MRVCRWPSRDIDLFFGAEALLGAAVLSETFLIFAEGFFHVGESSSRLNTPSQPIVEVNLSMISDIERLKLESLGKRELSHRFQFIQQFDDALHSGLTESGQFQHRGLALALSWGSLDRLNIPAYITDCW